MQLAAMAAACRYCRSSSKILVQLQTSYIPTRIASYYFRRRKTRKKNEVNVLRSLCFKGICNMPLVLHLNPASPCVSSVLLTLRALGIDDLVTKKAVDLSKGEHLAADYVQVTNGCCSKRYLRLNLCVHDIIYLMKLLLTHELLYFSSVYTYFILLLLFIYFCPCILSETGFSFFVFPSRLSVVWVMMRDFSFHRNFLYMLYLP